MKYLSLPNLTSYIITFVTLYCSRCYVSVAVLDGCIYAMGGFDGHVRQNTAERYTPSTNQWTLLAPMHHQRSDASATTLEGKAIKQILKLQEANMILMVKHQNHKPCRTTPFHKTKQPRRCVILLKSGPLSIKPKIIMKNLKIRIT